MHEYKHVGSFKHYNVCRFCHSNTIIPVINLGYVPLAGAFIKNKRFFEKELFYPLELYFCPTCYLLQSSNVIDKDALFKNYYYYSSAIKTLTDFFESISLELKNLYEHADKRFIVEIGCNDGALLKLIKKKGFRVLGIDPASNIVKPLIKKGYPVINDYFTEILGEKLARKHGKADAIVSFNTLAHIEDMHSIVKGIKTLLKKDGFLVFGVHYLGSLVKEIQYDMIYHEHQYYYSTLTLKKFFNMYDMEIYDVKPITIHAGSMVYYVQNKKFGKRKISENVKMLIRKERKQKLHKKETYLLLSRRIEKSKVDLVRLLKNLKIKNKSIAGYGASGRATTIINFCRLDNSLLDFIIDDAPAKQGVYTPGIHFKVSSSSILTKKSRPDYVLLFAWSFMNEIVRKNTKYLHSGGKFIVPLPKTRIA